MPIQPPHVPPDPESGNSANRPSTSRTRGVLFINANMILLPREGIADLPDAVRDLPDGQYTVPQCELPGPVWESFPRADPHAVLEACAGMGPKLHFDQPGGIHLVPRQALFDIHGFDQRMIHAGHVDS